jgi:hypothetical protein
MRRPIAAALAALVGLEGIVVPAHGAMIISGNFEGDGVLTPTGTPGVFVQDLTGEGDDTTLGPERAYLPRMFCPRN